MFLLGWCVGRREFVGRHSDQQSSKLLQGDHGKTVGKASYDQTETESLRFTRLEHMQIGDGGSSIANTREVILKLLRKKEKEDENL